MLRYVLPIYMYKRQQTLMYPLAIMVAIPACMAYLPSQAGCAFEYSQSLLRQPTAQRYTLGTYLFTVRWEIAGRTDDNHAHGDPGYNLCRLLFL